MKSLKAAAVVAGSLAMAGAAAPAFAAGASGLTPSSLNGALETVTSQRSLSAQDVLPLQHQSNALDTEDKFSFTFTTPGSYAYFCALHPHMTGSIVVEAAGGR